MRSSLAVSVGANVKAVQLMLGHASAAITLDVYADLFEDDLDDVGEALNAAATALTRLALHGENMAFRPTGETVAAQPVASVAEIESDSQQRLR